MPCQRAGFLSSMTDRGDERDSFAEYRVIAMTEAREGDNYNASLTTAVEIIERSTQVR